MRAADIRPDVEYQEVNNMIREYTRIRLQAFNFTLIFNGALLASFEKLTNTPMQQFVISFLATISTVILLLIEIRTISIADKYVDHAKELESTLRFSMHTKVAGTLEKSVFRTRFYFNSIYLILIIMWIAIFWNSLSHGVTTNCDVRQGRLLWFAIAEKFRY